MSNSKNISVTNGNFLKQDYIAWYKNATLICLDARYAPWHDAAADGHDAHAHAAATINDGGAGHGPERHVQHDAQRFRGDDDGSERHDDAPERARDGHAAPHGQHDGRTRGHDGDAGGHDAAPTDAAQHVLAPAPARVWNDVAGTVDAFKPIWYSFTMKIQILLLLVKSSFLQKIKRGIQ